MPTNMSFAWADTETVRINNFPLLDVIAPANRIFVSNTGHADEFTLDTSHLAKTSTAFTYQIHSESNGVATLAPLCPLIFELVRVPRKEPTADEKPDPLTDKELRLRLQYRVNPAALPASSDGTDVAPLPLTLHRLILVLTYEGKASAVKTGRGGKELRGENLVYWKFDDVTLPAPARGSEGEWSNLLCRISPAGDADLQPGHVEARWEYTPQQGGGGARVSLARLLEDKGKGKAVEEAEADADPFSDDNPISPRPDDRHWEAVPLVSQAVSGLYLAKDFKPETDKEKVVSARDEAK